MSNKRPSKLRFNVGFLLEAPLGTSRQVELSYPTIWVSEDLTLTPLTGTFTMTRTSEGIYLSGTLESAYIVECVRCLGEANVAVQIKPDDLFYYPPATVPEGEFFVRENGFLDLAPLVRELSLLEMPIRPICSATCQGLCKECGQNLNEADCGCVVEELDPRMAVLRQLLE